MRISNKTLIFSILAAFSAIRLLAAPDDHGSHAGHDHNHHDEHDHEIYENATTPELLHMMEESLDALAAASETSESEGLHETIETLADAGKALAAKSIDLKESQVLRIKSAVTSMEKIAHKLEESLESGKTSDTRKYVSQLKKLFASIEGQFPEQSHGDHDHEHDH